MCFDYDVGGPTVFVEEHRTAIKQHRCDECFMPIRPGERYWSVFGVWEGEASRWKCCFTCEWFRDRIGEAEMEHGCSAHEAYPAFGCLYEALGEGHGEMIGLVSLDDYDDLQERMRKGRKLWSQTK